MKQPDDFAARLRDAADKETPDFSDELHTRVMSAVRRERAAARTGVTPSLWRIAIPLGIAGVVIVAGVLTFLVYKPTAPQTELVMPEIPSLENMVRETAEPVRQKLHDARFAYLDRDGKRLAKFLWRSVPGTPKWPNDKHEPGSGASKHHTFLESFFS